MGNPSPHSPSLRLVRSDGNAESSLSDDDLLEAIARGDRKLGGELCRRLMRVVDATLYRVMGRHETDHDDLVQAAFEQIVITLYGGKFSRQCSLTTWAAAITCNTALHAIRRRRLERRYFDVSEGADELTRTARAAGDSEAQLAARAELERVRFHLAKMPEKLSQALLLHDMLGFSLTEAAALSGASKAAAQSRLVRGRSELERRLERDTPRAPRGGGP